MTDPDFFERLERELRLATDRRAARRRQGRVARWRRRPLILVLAGVIIATPALAASGVLTTGAPTRMCRADPSLAARSAQPVIGSLDPALNRILAVFRRAQTPADVLPSPITRVGPLGPFFASYDTNLTRLAYTAPDGRRFYLIPATTAPTPLLLDCTPSLTPAEREKQERTYARFHPTTQIAVLDKDATGPGYGAESGNTNAQTVLTGLALGGIVGTHGGYLWGFVPDGVASVTIITRAAPKPITARVENNMFFVGRSSRNIVAINGAKTIIWRDAAARAIKTIDADPCLQFHRPTTRARCETNLAAGPPRPPSPSAPLPGPTP